MKRVITTLALAATMVLATASVALADFPAGTNPNPNAECEPVSTVTHGEHILGYVTGVGAGDGVPAHFGDGEASPGASFCRTNNNAASPTGPPAP